MAVRPIPRLTERVGFSVPVRLRLLESDMDEQDVSNDRFDKKLDHILSATIAVLISLTTSAVLMALNLMVK